MGWVALSVKIKIEGGTKAEHDYRLMIIDNFTIKRSGASIAKGFLKRLLYASVA